MIIIFFILLMGINLNAQDNIELIALGETCTVAGALRTLNVRNVAYPLDWTISSFSALYAAIADDFKDYLNPQYFKIRADKHGVINKYGIVFVHDFPTVHDTDESIQTNEAVTEGVLSPEWLHALPLVQDKYTRRINRFIEACNSKNKIYFLRHFGISRNTAIKFRNLIETKYPHLNFVLVAVGNHPAYAQQWGEHKIKNYYLNDTQAWNDIREWERIFKDLGILPDDKSK